MMMWELVKALRNQKGQGMVEYGLILGLISVAAVALMSDVGDAIITQLRSVITALTPAS